MANSEYLRGLILQRTFLDERTLPSLWVSLHSDDPGALGANELAEYARAQVRFVSERPGEVSNRDQIEYQDMPEATVTHFGVWDAQREGRYLTGGQLDFGLMVSKGRTLRWRPGDLALRIP